MPPQKRGRQGKPSGQHDAEMKEPDARMDAAAEASSSDDSDDDEDDALTFAEKEDDEEEDEDEDDAMDGGDGADAANGALASRHVNVEFVFVDPRESHFHSVKQFVMSLLPSSQPLDVSGLASLIVAQRAVGTMVSVEGEEDVYGFITALGLQRYADQGCVQQVLQYLGKRCPASEAARFQALLANHSVALVVNERMVNLPYQLVPPLHSALHEDIEWAVVNAETEDLRQSFAFDYLLLMTSCSLEAASAGGNGKGKKNKKAKTEYAASSAKYFAHFEDEFLEAEAELVFSFETPRGDHDRVGDVQHTVVMVVERSRHKAALGSIAAMING